MTPLEYGRGMIFPLFYDRPKWTAREEAEHDARMLAEEQDPDLAFWESLPEADTEREAA
jgi:hypothetical protein